MEKMGADEYQTASAAKKQLGTRDGFSEDHENTVSCRRVLLFLRM